MTFGARLRVAVTLALLAGAMGACSRPEITLTPCVDGAPAKPRIHDVAPPNCTGP